MRARWELLAIASALALTLTVGYWRLFVGVDFTDESSYVVEPLRFALGARPFVDETALQQQTTALLLTPPVWLYTHLTGRTGLVLFVRNLYFLLSLGVAACVFNGARRLLSPARASVVAASALAFAPLSIHSVSYDTLGSGFLTAGCFLAAPGAAGIAHAVAVFAYPPLILPVLVSAVVRRRREARASYWLSAVALPVCTLAALYLWAGLGHVLAAFRISSRYLGEGGGLEKLHAIAHHWRTTWLPWLDATTSLEFVAHYGWLALPLYALTRRRAGTRRLLLEAWLPALIGGVVTAYSSNNGGIVFGLGFFPAAIVTTVFLVIAVESTRLRALAAAPAIVVLGLLLVFEAIPVYRDARVEDLSARVRTGPFAGLLTSRAKRTYAEDLGERLAGLDSSCRVLFFRSFPAGYLLTNGRPDTNAAWVFDVAPSNVYGYEDRLVHYYDTRQFPDVVVLMLRIPRSPGVVHTETYAPDDHVLRAVRAHHLRLDAATGSYRIYTRPHGRCRSRRAHA